MVVAVLWVLFASFVSLAWYFSFFEYPITNTEYRISKLKTAILVLWILLATFFGFLCNFGVLSLRLRFGFLLTAFSLLLRGCWANPKFEYRNPKQIQNSNYLNLKPCSDAIVKFTLFFWRYIRAACAAALLFLVILFSFLYRFLIAISNQRGDGPPTWFHFLPGILRALYILHKLAGFVRKWGIFFGRKIAKCVV